MNSAKTDYEKRKAEMFKLRKPPFSWTYLMIAKKFGITKQRVRKIIGKISRYES